MKNFSQVEELSLPWGEERKKMERRGECRGNLGSFPWLFQGTGESVPHLDNTKSTASPRSKGHIPAPLLLNSSQSALEAWRVGSPFKKRDPRVWWTRSVTSHNCSPDLSIHTFFPQASRKPTVVCSSQSPYIRWWVSPWHVIGQKWVVGKAKVGGPGLTWEEFIGLEFSIPQMGLP